MALASYGELYAEFYSLEHPEPDPQSLDTYKHYAQKVGGLVLEPMCGSGRYLIPLLQAGFSVEGLDSSKHMLKRCANQCEEQGLRVKLHRGTLETMQLDSRFDLIVIPIGSFNLITNRDIAQQALERVYRQLKPGGLFVFDVETVQNVDPQLGVWKGKLLTRPDGSELVASRLRV